MSRFSGKESRSHTLTPHERSLSWLTTGSRSGNIAAVQRPPQVLRANLITTSRTGCSRPKSLGPMVQMKSPFDYFNTVFKTSELLQGGKSLQPIEHNFINSMFRKGHFECIFLGVNSLALKKSDIH